jgi:5-methylcytosine-specific restriction endonuclease McrA
MIERKCLYCGDSFSTTNKRKIYCCRKHKQYANTVRRYGSHVNSKKKKRIKYITEINECSLCGFIALNKCQLDIDHIDGNHNNNDPNNLQVLCANCHRLKTYLNKDWENKIK